MMELLDEIVQRTEQRPIAEVAAECDKVFTDDTAKFPGEVVAEPFKTALDWAAKNSATALAVFERYYVKIYGTDARWMRALSLYQEWALKRRMIPLGTGKDY